MLSYDMGTDNFATKVILILLITVGPMREGNNYKFAVLIFWFYMLVQYQRLIVIYSLFMANNIISYI